MPSKNSWLLLRFQHAALTIKSKMDKNKTQTKILLRLFMIVYRCLSIMISSSVCFIFIVSHCSSIKDKPLKNSKMKAIGKKKIAQKKTHFQLPPYSKYEVVLVFTRAKFFMSRTSPIGKKIIRKKISQKTLPLYLKEELDILTVRAVRFTLFILYLILYKKEELLPPPFIYYRPACACTSAAKSVSSFSIPSPNTKRAYDVSSISVPSLVATSAITSLIFVLPSIT